MFQIIVFVRTFCYIISVYKLIRLFITNNKKILFRYINVDVFPALNAYIGLAEPGLVGSWQSETKVI